MSIKSTVYLDFIRYVLQDIRGPRDYPSLESGSSEVAKRLLKAYARDTGGTRGPALQPQPPRFI